MPGAYLQGIEGAYDNQAQIKNDIAVIAINWYSNRCPVVTRIPRVPVGSTEFTMVARTYRPRSGTLGAAVADGTTTSITLTDASSYMIGDVLELNSGENVEITADPNVTTNVIAVRRGAAGTTGAAQSNGTAFRLIGNSRTGGEVDQNAVGFKPTAVPQWCQTFQHPVQVGGSLQASSAYQTQPGVSTPFEQNRMDALQNMMDDFETSVYYGRGESPAVVPRPKMKGIKTLLATNKTTSPTNASAYKPTDLMRDTLEKCRANGGSPDVLLVSTNFMTGLATWGHAAQRLDAGVNIFGTPINVFEAPFLGGITIVEAPLLRPFSAICLTSSEVRMRMKRNEFWNPRGVRGDAIEGDWMAEGAIEIDNEAHHAWVEGITAFSA